jgi:hypothetical protein
MAKEEYSGYSSVIDLPRLGFLVDQTQYVKDLPGAAVEIGVYKGGSLTRIAGQLNDRNKKVYGIDTFTGMPEPSEYDLHKKGDFNDITFQDIKEWFRSHFPNVVLIRGFFPQVANQIPENEFCFIHVDVDIYSSVMDCCNYFYPRLVTGGIMIFDDYGFPTTPGAKRAIDRYFEHREDCIKKVVKTGQYFVCKLLVTDHQDDRFFEGHS